MILVMRGVYQQRLGRSMGIDEGFGISEFGIVIMQGKEGGAEVIYAKVSADLYIMT